MGKRILMYTRAAIPTPKRQKQISPIDIKKEKIRLWKRGQKNRIADVREKRARFASGLARTARSARLRFCLFRRFVFIQGVCLSRRAKRADLFKTSIRLSAKGVKYRDKSRRV